MGPFEAAIISPLFILNDFIGRRDAKRIENLEDPRRRNLAKDLAVRWLYPSLTKATAYIGERRSLRANPDLTTREKMLFGSAAALEVAKYAAAAALLVPALSAAALPALGTIAIVQYMATPAISGLGEGVKAIEHALAQH